MTPANVIWGEMIECTLAANYTSLLRYLHGGARNISRYIKSHPKMLFGVSLLIYYATLNFQFEFALQFPCGIELHSGSVTTRFPISEIGCPLFETHDPHLSSNL